LRHWLNKAIAASMAASIVLAAAATAVRADRILTTKRIGITGKITGFSAGGVIIDADGNKQTIPVSEIAKVKADAYPDLERAEDAYAQGQAGKPQGFAEAERLYRDMTRTSSAPQWLRVLVQWRMYRVYADSGRPTEALDAYLELVRGGPGLVTGLKLPVPRDDAHEANKVMLKKVEDALRLGAGTPYAAELQSYRVHLLMLEGKPEEVMPILEPMLASPDEKTRQTAMLKQIEVLVAAGKFDDAAAKLDANGPALAQEHPDDITFWRGRILKERGQNMEAALEFMRLPILYPKDKARTADALWWAGQAMEAAKAPKDEVLKVYGEAVTRYAGTPGADRAKRELVRLGAK
jgi:tetratricopeptide (TPR) repeat protein